MKIRSAYLKSPWQCEIRQIDLPESPPPGELLIKIEACGICGSDLHAAEALATEWQSFGHEIAGVIEQIGPGCEGFEIGQKIVLESSSYCGTCDFCRNGKVELCQKIRNFWGRPALGFSDYMIVPAFSSVIYEGISPEVACLAEPAGVAYDLVKTAGIEMGSRVCLIGPGPIGLMAIPLALRSGASKVVCIGRSRNQKRLELARQLGAEVIIVDEPLHERPDLHGQFDRILNTAPAQVLGDALPLLAFGGIMSYIGFGAGEAKMELDVHNFHVRKLQLRASFASPGIYMPLVLEFLKADIIPGNLLISHIIDLAEIDGAMKLCQLEKDKTVKVVIKP